MRPMNDDDVYDDHHHFLYTLSMDNENLVGYRGVSMSFLSTPGITDSR